MNRYKEVRTLGKGSFGRAVLVYEISTGKHYVMKIIQTSTMKPKERQEALQEAYILEHLEHPNIIAYKESFQDYRFLYIIMEYANNGDLYELIKQQRQQNVLLAEEVIWDYFVQICLAVKHIHDRRILHRDLKTQNVFLTKVNGRVVCKIGDFGVSKILSSTMECAKTAIGTPYYLSPELCNNQGYNNKSDVWALGCVLYEMCTLQHTFEAANMKMLIVKILEGKYKPIPSSYSEPLRRLITLLLQKDPKKRPSVNSLLRLPELQQRTDRMLSAYYAAEEFSHTAFHGKGNVIGGFEQEKEIKAVLAADSAAGPVKSAAASIFTNGREKIEGAEQMVGHAQMPQEKRQEPARPRAEIQAPRALPAAPPAAPAAPPAPPNVGYAPSDQTLLSKFNEIDQMLKNPSPQAAAARNAQVDADQRVKYPQNVARPAPAAPKPSYNAQQQPQNSPLGYAPPQQYVYKVSYYKQSLNQHQREVAAKLAPMSDRDRARYAREKELADKHAKAQDMRRQSKENIARGQQRVQDKYAKINEDYEQNLRARQQKMYRDQDELNARKAQLLQNKQQERCQRQNEMLEQQRKNQEIAERERERHDREREKLRQIMLQKRNQAAPKDEVEILESKHFAQPRAGPPASQPAIVPQSERPNTDEAQAAFKNSYRESVRSTPQIAPERTPKNGAAQSCEAESSQSFGDQPDALFYQPFNEHKNWHSLLVSQNEADSLCYRMESLKQYLEKELGFDRFLATYQEMQGASERDVDFDQEHVEKLLGTGNLGWMNLIVQLMLVEKRFNECY